jgi:hypothetical protein
VRRFLSNEEIDATKRVMGPSVNLVNVETPIKKTSKRIDRSLLNDDIEAAEVRLVAADGSQRGVVPSTTSWLRSSIGCSGCKSASL